MKHINQIQKIRNWARELTQKYIDVTVSFEFNSIRNVVFVSLDFVVEQTDQFYLDVMDFNNSLINEFGDYAPLFTVNEELFKLSESSEKVTLCSSLYACVVSQEIYNNFKTEAIEYSGSCGFNMVVTNN